MLLDTIAAISTPRGEGGISIVRMSGQDSLNILEKIFRAKSKKVSELKNYSINYGHIIDNEHIVDEVLVSIMKAPNTYTREDTHRNKLSWWLSCYRKSIGSSFKKWCKNC